MTATRFVLGAAVVAALGLGLVVGHFVWPSSPPPDVEPQMMLPPSALEPGRVQLQSPTATVLGVQTAPVKAGQMTPTQRVPGRLQRDPGFVWAVRVPMPGRLTAGPKPMPRLGDAVAAGTVIALLVPRLTAAEQADFVQRRATALADRTVAASTLASARLELDRMHQLHANGNNASLRDVERAEAEVDTQQARLAAAEQVLQSLPEAGLAPLPVSAPHAGIVDAVLAQIGEEVDAGAQLLQLGDPTHLLARIEVPAAADIEPSFPGASIELAGAAGAPLRTLSATRQAWVDGGSGDRAVLLAVDAPGGDLRPGLPVIAWLPRRGGPVDGVWLPESAILRRGDGDWVFVRAATEGFQVTFQRLPVRLEAARADGWLARPGADGPAVGAELVIEGAGALLSVERQRATDVEEGG